jgi:hypothetical protein
MWHRGRLVSLQVGFHDNSSEGSDSKLTDSRLKKGTYHCSGNPLQQVFVFNLLKIEFLQLSNASGCRPDSRGSNPSSNDPGTIKNGFRHIQFISNEINR